MVPARGRLPANSLKSGFYGSVAARLAGRPVVWHVRDRIADDYLPARVVRLTRLALRCLPDFVAIPGNTSDHWGEPEGREPERQAHPRWRAIRDPSEIAALHVNHKHAKDLFSDCR